MDTNIYCLPEAFAFAKQGNTMRRRRNHEWAERSSRKFERIALCPSKPRDEIAYYDQCAPTPPPIAMHVNRLACAPASCLPRLALSAPPPATVAAARPGGVVERKFHEEGHGNEEVEQRRC